MDESDELEYYKQRKYYETEKDRMALRKKAILVSVISAIFGLIIILIREVFYNHFGSLIGSIFVVLASICLVAGAGLLLLMYLQSGNRVQEINSERDLRLEIVVEELRLELIKLKKKTGIIDNKDDLSESINRIIESTITDHFLQTKIEKAYSEKIINLSKLNKIYDDAKSMGLRIDREINILRKSANLNLVIGTLTTVLAVFALSYEIFMKNIDFKDSVNLLSHYLPRISLAVFIEIFAFFFLKLYKSNLADIKYFNNEKTNIDFKIISLNTALQQNNETLLKLIIDELVKTERNFKLRKGESTVELEKFRNESENNKTLSELLKKLSEKI
ncbi:hypothetical protein [Fluviicola sp.]|jgi:hypothetical protein|uniref:hypothetical protein n=1 Tax=Fluviicola sp. TaxID=1917219 RepID=UPI00263A0AA2|nr:hypothetical protein [Fluviicola sp.]